MSEQAQQDRGEARAWLVGGCPDFQFVATAAGLDPGAARDGFLKLAARGWPRQKRARVTCEDWDADAARVEATAEGFYNV
jgi:hypothetical protein